MKNIYFVGAPTKAKGIQDFDFLANHFPEHNFYWFTYKLSEKVKKSYKKIKFIVGLESFELKKIISSKMDLFISCSYFEGFCLPIAEALLLDKPVISYKLPEVEAEFGNMITYVRCFDKLHFIEKVDKLLKSPVVSKKTRLAKVFVTQHYSPEAVSDKLLRIILN